MLSNVVDFRRTHKQIDADWNIRTRIRGRIFLLISTLKDQKKLIKFAK